MPNLRRAGKRSALRITLIYLITGGLWIAFSDRILLELLPNLPQLSYVQTIKGIIYVLATAALLHVLILHTITLLEATETATRIEKAKLKAVLENTTDLIWSVDRDYRLIAFNTACEQHFSPLLGVPLKTGMPFLTVLPTPMRPMMQTAFERTLQGERVTLAHPHHFGEPPRHFEIYCNPIHTNGDITGIASFARDITEREQMLAALRNSEARHRAISETISDFAYGMRLAPDGTLQWDWLVGAYDHITGYTIEEITSEQAWEKIIHPDDFPILRAANRAALMGKSAVHEIRIRTKSGATHWIQVHVRPIWDDPHLQIVQLVSAAQDITREHATREALRDSEAKYRTLFETSTDAIFLETLEGQVLDCNSAALTLYGYTAEEMFTLNVTDLVPKEIAVQLPRIITEELLQGSIFVEAMGKRKNGTVFPTEVNIRQAMIGDSKLVIVYVRDITERHRAQAALKKERTLLAERVAERTADLQAANMALAQASRTKDEFLANMSHELRTPLNAILGLTEALQEYVYGMLNETQSRALQQVQESGHDLLAIINDILDLSKIEAGKLTLDIGPVELETVCQASLRTVRQAAHAKHLNITYTTAPDIGIIQADGRLLKQILVNLLSNAIKFTPAGGTVGLDVSTDTTAPSLICCVWDTGIGIAVENQTRIFEPFVQVDSSLSRQYGGTGLGLALVHKLVQLHNGEITVTSEPGGGSRFTIYLPWQHTTPAYEVLLDLTPPPPTVARPARTSPEGTPAPHVLIVEDNAITLQTLRDYLQAYGYTVTCATDGLDAIEKALQELPALILMDIELPRLDGWDAIRRLRERPELADTPIVALTALAMPGDRERCITVGASAYLSKPVSLRRLTHVIREQLSVRREP